MMRGFVVLLATLLVLALAAPVIGCGDTVLRELSTWTWDETVQTLYGPVVGFEDGADAWVWKAIPYAQPPVAKLRWRAPIDPDPWSRPRAETEFCSECPQYDIGGDVFGDEDCLYLNVWRPQSDETGLPVYFWIHGGGNSGGSASNDAYNGANIASRSDLVVVTVNYRLGPLGWFTHPSLRSGEGDHELDDSGNYGTLDQNGNVYQWNDLSGAAGKFRGLRGGFWAGGGVTLQKSTFTQVTATREANDAGFRLVGGR